MAEQKKQDTNQLLKVRREKLADLQANGKDPFQITKFDHYLGGNRIRTQQVRRLPLYQLSAQRRRYNLHY